ncbi:hypothetical protein [Kordiimonas laminariae]|uniref:hypothetical protein n=1 Tax=Kordiimonas laminariae TaxID=2917717 RepID=UPI001FF140D1|nr:hypothetical protein [Kordiimonas laminariae]MCK0067878.1 hypothetical protein [Kordiimonas laminariae]
MASASAFDMNALDSRIRELVAYARERDGEDRSILFRNLIDLFLTGKAPKITPTRSQLLDVIEALIPHVDSDNRRTAADLIAGMSNPPFDLAIRLCRDRASLVSNLLKSLPMDEEEVIELISQTGREHHQIIATRNDLSANVWIALARAAPAAPPFDNQSTLALWSDDLGITRTAAQSSGTVTPFPEHKTRQSSLRILKTDEDLIAERSREMQQETEFPDQDDMHSVPASEPETEMFADEQPTMIADDQRSPAETQTSKVKAAKDPSPGGWSWISDRDGFVVSISPFATAIFGEGYASGDTSILDLLGLNEKLGHPVARAFQRRSAIHDAPVTIQFLEDAHQNWTMEATPVFSQCGGIFEGYEGSLAPVLPAKGDDTVFPSETDANALFLDEVVNNSDLFPKDHIAAPPQRERKRTPAAFTEEPSVLADYDDAPINPSEMKRPSAETLARATINTTTQAPVTEPSKPKSPIDSAAAAIESLLADEVAPAFTQAKEPQDKSLPDSVEWDPPIDKASADKETLLSTVHMLEESLKRLSDICSKDDNPQAKLQCEIASACMRTLRDQLNK